MGFKKKDGISEVTTVIDQLIRLKPADPVPSRLWCFSSELREGQRCAWCRRGSPKGSVDRSPDRSLFENGHVVFGCYGAPQKMAENHK